MSEEVEREGEWGGGREEGEEREDEERGMAECARARSRSYWGVLVAEEIEKGEDG